MISTSNTARPRLMICGATLLALSLASGCANLNLGHIAGPHLVTPPPPAIPQGGAPVPAGNVAVLTAGNQVVANTPEGKIKIEAGPGMRRVFTWDGLRRGAIMQGRDMPFAGAGSKGIYFDGTPKVWEDAKGITRLRYEEGRRNFENDDDASIWMQIRRMYYAYNNSGLVVGWKREGKTLHVEVWQFYINGALPTSMPKADDTAINVSPTVVEPQKMLPRLKFSDGHTEPYNAQTASELNQGSTSTASTTAAASETPHCNFFQKLFGKCPAAPEPEAVTTSVVPAPKAAPVKAPPPPPAPEPTLPSATISGATVNIRSDSNTKSDVLFQAKQGDHVGILKEDRGWRYVKFDDGRKGWVADFLLKH